jgi:hypothetical protein
MINKVYILFLRRRFHLCVFIILLFGLSVNCTQQTGNKAFGNNIARNTKQLKQIKTFLFHISDQIDSIGYKNFEDGEIMSIACIKTIDDFVFLSDPVHCNIKRINLKDGKLIASNILDKDSSFLSSISFHKYIDI